MRKILSGIMSIAMAAGLVTPIKAEAKLLEPEVIYTDTWTTNYFIDGDYSIQYPYIDCELEIYNNGRVAVSFWNTHEWDAFINFTHSVDISSTLPVPAYPEDAEDATTSFIRVIDQDTYETIDYVDVSYYPPTYSFQYDQRIIRNEISMATNFQIKPYFGASYLHGASTNSLQSTKYGVINGILKRQDGVNWFSAMNYFGSLGELQVGEKYTMYFNPQKEPVGENKFRVFGKDFTVSRVDLSQALSIQAPETDSEVTALKAKISNLEQENRTLYEQLEIYLPHEDNSIEGDIDGNGVLDARDASMLLTLYARQSVGENITLADLRKELV